MRDREILCDLAHSSSYYCFVIYIYIYNYESASTLSEYAFKLVYAFVLFNRFQKTDQNGEETPDLTLF